MGCLEVLGAESQVELIITQAFRTEDFEAAHALHEKMGCICYENPAMGIYFINDPDGYWLEIVPDRKK